MKFLSHGRQYEIIKETGHIEQLDAQPFKYDPQYASTYDTPAYVQGNEVLQHLRLGVVLGVCGGLPRGLLDYGYGNGAFLKVAVKAGIPCWGYDISGVEPPEGADRMEAVRWEDGKEYDWQVGQKIEVVTFWDCLEHIPKKTLDTNLQWFRHKGYKIVVSLPNCNLEEHVFEWFSGQYVHRKPDEHLRHFSEDSLTKFMAQYKYQPVYAGYHEDLIRKRGERNILTMAFKSA